MQQNNFDLLFIFLKDVISWRIRNPERNFSEAPTLSKTALSSSAIAEIVKSQKLSAEEYTVLILALVPHFLPDLLLNIVTEEFPQGTDFPLFGGVKGKNHRGILPTGETAQFILGGTNVQNRISVIKFFKEDHPFHKEGILYLDSMPKGEPLMSGSIHLHTDILYLLTTGEVPTPKLSTDFPAEKLETALTWDDLVLNEITIQQVKDIEIWLEYNQKLLQDWDMKARIKDGYRVLFHGPPGTGKTLTAALLGKYTKKPVYRIDLSTVVSKYIGETEKNLSNLFDKAANKDWILFFDEADAIFGKRTGVRDAHDRYANQEVSYLLQRIESHNGLIILASNLKDNIDDAFVRRFQAIVGFGLPGYKERKELWEKNLPPKLKLAPDVDLDEIAVTYELSGSNIMNIIHYCSLIVLSMKSDELTAKILIKGIKKEFQKEKKVF